MASIKINTEKTIGKIKPMNAVGQPPVGGLGKNISGYFHYLSEIGIPYSRLHDVGGVFGGGKYVDIPNIFRDFDADVDDPASYDFTFTDVLITALIEHGIEPYYRLGVTIENNAEIKSYTIDPPRDFEKWASICEHIVAHYNEGWADGFHYNITYWEIWAEPDDGARVSQLWNGTPEEYYRLYDITSKKLKARFPDIKVGGYASISVSAGYKEIPETRADYAQQMHYIKFFHGFWNYIKEHNCPIDFYSWHCYADVVPTCMQADYIIKTIAEYGYGDIEIHLNEWNPIEFQRGTPVHGAQTAAMMLAMQSRPEITLAAMYDAARLQGSSYCAFFEPYTLKPTLHAYYSFAAFNILRKLENEVELECDTNGLYMVAAVKNGKGAVMISNISGAEQELNIEGVDLEGARWYVIDRERLLSWTPAMKTIGNNMVVLIEFNA